MRVRYLLLLKGNYECSPGAMANVIRNTCSLQLEGKAAPPSLLAPSGTGSTDAPAAAAAAVGGSEGEAEGGGGGFGGSHAFCMNGFWLYRNKMQYGPAQQAYILLNAFERFSCEGVTRMVVSGGPMASINRCEGYGRSWE